MMRRSPTTLKKQATEATITQKMLGEYHELYSHEKQIKMQREKLRTELIQYFQQGALVQPGKFQLSMSTRESVRLSWSHVLEVLGKDAGNLLREQIPPTSST